MKRFKLLHILIAFLFVLTVASALFSPPKVPPKASTTVTLGGTVFSLEIADTPEAQTKGLGDRKSLGATSGMLFIFNMPGNYPFWMKDTLIPLDMGWLDEHFCFVHLEKAVSPNTFPTTFTSETPAQYVLEVNKGVFESHNVTVGTCVEHGKI